MKCFSELFARWRAVVRELPCYTHVERGARKWLAALGAALQCPAGVVHATTSEDLEGSGLTLAQWVAKVVPV